MQDFEYYTPTHVVFGKHAVERVGELITGQNGKKVLIHYGGGSAKRSGLLDRVTDALEQSGISYVMLGGVVPNPRLGLVREGIALCKREGVDFILAVGGGSVIDSSKAIAYGIANDGDVWDFYAKKRVPQACAPVGTILTIAAAGSEMSNSSVITNEDGWLKRGLSTELCRCKFAIMDPTLTYTLPAYQTASGAADVMMHTMERYFTQVDTLGLTDSIAESLLKSVMRDVTAALKNPEDYDARAGLMWASSLSHNGLTGCGTDGGDWSCHQLEHELSGKYDVAHGAGLCAVWSSWARTVMPANPARFAKFAIQVMGVQPGADDIETANRGIDAMEAFFQSIGMPVRINQMGIELTEEDMRELAYKCSFMDTRKIGRFVPLDKEAIYKVYQKAKA
ncbi:iron-containing alcohol dehydrogenase [Butyricicoccus porcorum]|uniref:NADH-dependent alcohol dehydrogenase n=1 Tax=Butyricicoccus porcorum TaxID=1945634 RepID=A0A252F301_9FIRM|nr:iron-containing alcohol dehydrogenase [Butyricicoccus porcorum]MDD6987423.1 iron-containing alcohol dehydrogenase [Butyricicoccus porcorum]MDY4482917.1 iron-containing alcohol dehydrogenase [Butyricicoccus porcorum]OUM20109.1 NADH-dependent alcohol dehydrogenase [Butyricicoccus porcorum]